MANGYDFIKALSTTKKYIAAYGKIGTDELIVEAEKCYVYEQYDLAYEIAYIILEGKHYSQETLARAYELYALILYYHSDELYGRNYNNPKQEAYDVLHGLASKNWSIYDARYILGNMYAEKGYYEEAMGCFLKWMSERDRASGLKALVEMFKRGQYDTDEQYSRLSGMYFLYYLNRNKADLLLKSAKYVEEYFPQYIHEAICEKLELPVRQVSKIHYEDEDFILPYTLRCFDCANHIRAYVRNTKNPTAEGCMRFLAQREVQLDIQQRTARARQKELEDALLRSHIRNENTKIEIMRKEAEENARRYEHMKTEMEKYNQQMLDYQKKGLQNQKKILEQQREIKSQVDSVKSDLNWGRWF